jgi:hypothetical protein
MAPWQPCILANFISILPVYSPKIVLSDIMSYPILAPLFEWSPWKTILEFAARAHQSTTTFVTEHSVSGNHGQLSAAPECKSAVHFLASVKNAQHLIFPFPL